MADPASEQPFEESAEGDRREQLAAMLERLPERDRRVIELRFGLGDGTARTADEVAEALGVTRQRVRQIELRALLALGRAAQSSQLRAA